VIRLTRAVADELRLRGGDPLRPDDGRKRRTKLRDTKLTDAHDERTISSSLERVRCADR
jgi:hypothetical protein